MSAPSSRKKPIKACAVVPQTNLEWADPCLNKERRTLGWNGKVHDIRHIGASVPNVRTLATQSCQKNKDGYCILHPTIRSEAKKNDKRNIMAWSLACLLIKNNIIRFWRLKLKGAGTAAEKPSEDPEFAGGMFLDPAVNVISADDVVEPRPRP